MLDIQKMLDAVSKVAADTRADYHLTLGELVEALDDAPDDMPVVFDRGGAPCRPHSYRGYYSDLSLEETPDAITVEPFRREMKETIGETFEGYKGGDFTMTEATPLWHAPYGCCGPAIMGAVIGDGKLVLITKDIEA